MVGGRAAEVGAQQGWPTQKPITPGRPCSCPGRRGKRRAWTAADQYLVDEANTLLNGTPFTYAHVVVDEAQDHSAVALRVIGRRSPAGSLTLVGDVAQSTTPAGQERWADVFAHLGRRAAGVVADLTIGYRVPEPILEVANRLLPLTGVDATASRSVRNEGDPPSWHRCRARGAVRRRWRSVVADGQAPSPPDRRRRPARSARPRSRRRWRPPASIAVDHVHELGHDDVPLFGPEAVKGLEFDGVVVVNPHEILDG